MVDRCAECVRRRACVVLLVGLRGVMDRYAR